MVSGFQSLPAYDLWRVISVRCLLLLGLLALTSLAQAYDGLCESPEDVAALPPGHWCEIPDSHLRSVEKKPDEWPDWDGKSSPSYDSFQRINGVKAVIQNWSGGTYDNRRDRLLVMGGGHNGYGGNEIYSFDLNSLRWTRLTDPTAFPRRSPATENPDGTPLSRHTYGGLAYAGNLDQLFLLGGGPDADPGVCGIQGTWFFDLHSLESVGSYDPSQWIRRTAEGEPDTGCEDDAIYDPISGKIFYQFGTSPSGWASYDVNSNIWRALTNQGILGQATPVIPGNRRFIVHFGNGAENGYVRWGGLDDQVFEKMVVATKGAKNMEQVPNPGAAYDWKTDRIVAWAGGSNVYALDVDQNIWQEHRPADTNITDPGPTVAFGGTYGRFAYSKTLNVFIVVDHVDENVFLYRLAPGAGVDPDPNPNPPEDLAVQ